MSNEDNKSGQKFWIAALAFSILLLATTFALMATYLAEIKNNTTTALTRSDVVAERLNTLDMELAFIHRHLMEQKNMAPLAVAAPVEPVPTAPSAAPGEAATGSIPVIQPPTLAPAPTSIVPAPAVPAETPAPAKP